MAPDRLPALPSEQDRRPGPQAGTAARMSNFRITPNALSHKLKLHQLQIFERVLARRSLSRAASEMHLTQPTVTKAIHDLEAFFGATLFERSNRRHADRAGAGAGPARARHDGRDPLHGRRHRRGARRRQRPRGGGHADRGLGQAAARGHRAADDRASRHPVTVRGARRRSCCRRWPRATSTSWSGGCRAPTWPRSRAWPSTITSCTARTFAWWPAPAIRWPGPRGCRWPSWRTTSGSCPPPPRRCALDRAQLLRRRRAPAHASRRIAVAADQYRHPDAATRWR